MSDHLLARLSCDTSLAVRDRATRSEKTAIEGRKCSVPARQSAERTVVDTTRSVDKPLSYIAPRLHLSRTRLQGAMAAADVECSSSSSSEDVRIRDN
ncbi:hypothetical protein MTO96_012782 [Rhipicephalus appendiculatus]